MSEEIFDVIVVGSGFAGLSAAIEAKNAGCSVVVIEKMRVPGGNSAISGGLFAVAESPLQAKMGIIDSPEQLTKDMCKAGHGMNYIELARTAAEQSKEAFLWVQDYLGVDFNDTLLLGGGHSVPRIYNTTTCSGAVIVQALLVKCRELNITIRTNCAMSDLIQDEKGSVTGVAIASEYVFPQQNSGIPAKLMARKAVVLATGGFCQDLEFRMIQDPRLDETFESTNQKGATAEALVSALRIGATPVQLSSIQLGPWTSRDEFGWGVSAMFSLLVGFPYGIMVDANTGKRIINELADRLSRVTEMTAAGRIPLLIVSSEAAHQYQHLKKCIKRKVIRQYDSVEELALAHSIDLNSLTRTIQLYNESIESGIDTELGKPLHPDKKFKIIPPLYVVRLKPKLHFCNGGIQINSTAQVLNIKSHAPIHRLYAAGEVTGGVHGASRIGGMAICESIVFGRIAGLMAAHEPLSST